MNPDNLKKIIDEIFAVLETATTGNFFLHMMVGVLHQLALALLPKIAGNLRDRGIVS